MNRRTFLRMGALFVHAGIAPRVVSSFLWPSPGSGLPRATLGGVPFPESLRGVGEDEHVVYPSRRRVARVLAIYVSGVQLGEVAGCAYNS